MKNKKREKFWFENAEETNESPPLDRNIDINKLMKGMMSPMRFRIRMPQMRRLEDKRFPIDISDKGDMLIIKADLPGFKKEDIVLKVTPRTINILAQNKGERDSQKESFYRRERSSGSIRRAFKFPVEIKPEFVKAKMENGILRIEMPKLIKEKKREKKIKIK